MQNCNFVGRLTKAANLTYNNQARATFTLAVESRNGTYVSVDFIPCVAWRELAEIIANHTVSGQRISIIGKMRSRPYTKNNENRIHYEIEVYECEFLDAPNQTSK